MSKIRAVVVDDEPFARQRIRRLLEAEADVEIVGEAGNGVEAVSIINRQTPDLVLLDVQMPGKDGFGVVDELPAEKTPLIIFLTAYDKYAVRAFEAAALDYILKPFEPERFTKAVARARAQLAQSRDRTEQPPTATTIAVSEKLQGPDSAPSNAYLERVVIRANGRVFFRRADEIDWVEAFGNYVRLHIGAAAYLLRETIGSLEAQLDPQKFVRLHRSTLVQVDRIREIQPQPNGQSKAVLRDGTHLIISRRYRRRLPASLA